MGLTKTFVVRIYRCDHGPGEPLAGTVESIDRETTQPFSSFEELRSILEYSRSPRTPVRHSKPKRRA